MCRTEGPSFALLKPPFVTNHAIPALGVWAPVRRRFSPSGEQVKGDAERVTRRVGRQRWNVRHAEMRCVKWKPAV